MEVLLIRNRASGRSQPTSGWSNKDNFLKLKVGMTLKELEDIIGVGKPAKRGPLDKGLGKGGQGVQGLPVEGRRLERPEQRDLNPCGLL